MNQNQEKPMEGHEYDGIQEFDNPLPGWWLLTFFGTIIFSFLYYLHYEVASGPNQEEQLKKSLAAIESLKKGGPALDDEKLLALFQSSSPDKGKSIYAAKCAACHGAQGEGLIGPNLTDTHFIHGGSPLAMYNVISNGVLDKGMPPWKDQLSFDDSVAVTAFVYKLKGTFAANGRPPQGTPEKTQ
ncbi:MAG: c-type cytochrome [Bdellovibrionaceae bacterium]|nr:c-type cytochrome [Pseudobdellovibrionaceae bacterium]MDW8190192.1 cbb3-type cytochrome c oxidase N-terminal domain-containing protein [Pseudobdellovibrionaceae bacterium]